MTPATGAAALPSNLTEEHEFPFLGAEVAVPYETARIVILPIPFERTTTYRQGCQHGPAAILEASHQVEYYDDELAGEAFHAGIFTCGAIADTRLNPNLTSEEMLAVTQSATEVLIDDGKFVIALGGEHSITEGIVAAYQQRSGEPFTVVQIDAHGDLRHEYEGSIHNHACVMRRVVDMGIPTVQIGIRSLCREEAQLIRDQNLPILWARDIATQPDWMERAIAQIPTRNVFLTIDLDGIDPALMPGVGTPEPGGLSWYGLLAFLKRLFDTHTVIGCDVMELAPVSDSVVSEFTAARLVYKLIGYQSGVK
ncbi:MAG: agmatinase [Synechococcales bacterium]|nr:agmatinase [Synechococcales bacterium]